MNRMHCLSSSTPTFSFKLLYQTRRSSCGGRPGRAIVSRTHLQDLSPLMQPAGFQTRLVSCWKIDHVRLYCCLVSVVRSSTDRACSVVTCSGAGAAWTVEACKRVCVGKILFLNCKLKPGFSKITKNHPFAMMETKTITS
jgi:hypothetical protein